ncbi:30S ribosomal protein S3 [bacterium]|nr:MAG: 30S ribosomal protein S3 [bacterium]
MGHKTNPIVLRLGVNKTHSSSWFSKTKLDFAKNLAEDNKVRRFIEKKLDSSGIESIFIYRNINDIQIDVTVARPGVVIGRGGKAIEDLKKDLAKLLKVKVDVKIIESKNPESQAAIVAYMVADQCKRRVSPKQAMQRELLKMKAIPSVRGAKISVSGRIRGTEIARTEKVSFGSVPLQTLKANVDYHLYNVRVPNAGLHGIKVWIYKEDKLEK